MPRRSASFDARPRDASGDDSLQVVRDEHCVGRTRHVRRRLRRPRLRPLRRLQRRPRSRSARPADFASSRRAAFASCTGRNPKRCLSCRHPAPAARRAVALLPNLPRRRRPPAHARRARRYCCATLAAPPRRYSSRSNCTTGTGASGEIRVDTAEDEVVEHQVADDEDGPAGNPAEQRVESGHRQAACDGWWSAGAVAGARSAA